MGHKVNPIGFRLGIIKDWQSRWFAPKGQVYQTLLQEDIRIRRTILSQYSEASISRIDIERSAHDFTVTIHTARPGIVIGRGGQRVEELRQLLESLTQRRARVNIQEIRQPELDAYLVARNVAEQLERRIAFRRAVRQAITRARQAGAEGVKAMVSGRLGGAEIARREKAMEGRMPLHTLRADIDYGFTEAATPMGRIGVKVWIFKGEVLPEAKESEEEMATIEVTLRADEEEKVESTATTDEKKEALEVSNVTTGKDQVSENP